jgi:hypothetical protein
VKEVLARKRETGYMPVNIAAEKSRLKRLLEDAQSKTEKDHDLIARLVSTLSVQFLVFVSGNDSFLFYLSYLFLAIR